MHPVTYRLGLLAGVASTGLVPLSARADIIYSIPIVSPAAAIQDIPDVINVAVPSFNPADYPGAQLLGINLTVWGRGTGIYRVTNDSPTTAYQFTNGAASGKISVTYLNDTSLEVVDTIGMNGINGTALAAPNAQTPSKSYFPGQSVTGRSTFAVPTSKFAEFETPNQNVQLEFTATVSNLSAQGQAVGRGATTNLNYGATATITSAISIDYRLPEPAALSVAGTALVGLGLVRRRKRSG